MPKEDDNVKPFYILLLMKNVPFEYVSCKERRYSVKFLPVLYVISNKLNIKLMTFSFELKFTCGMPALATRSIISCGIANEGGET